MLGDHPEALSKLRDELIGWLTTVDGAGQSQASPIWHVTDEDDLIVFSRVNARRLSNLRSNPKVAYNLRGDKRGDVIVMEGTARVDSAFPGPSGVADYVDKYGKEMLRLGWSPEEYDAEFPVAIRIKITRVRALGA